MNDKRRDMTTKTIEFLKQTLDEANCFSYNEDNLIKPIKDIYCKKCCKKLTIHSVHHVFNHLSSKKHIGIKRDEFQIQDEPLESKNDSKRIKIENNSIDCELNSDKKKLDELEIKINRAYVELEVNKSQKSYLEKIKAVQIKEIQDLKEKQANSTNSIEIDKLKQELDSLNRQNDNLKERRIGLEKEYLNLKERLHQKETEKQILKEENLNYRQKIDKMDQIVKKVSNDYGISHNLTTFKKELFNKLRILKLENSIIQEKLKNFNYIDSSRSIENVSNVKSESIQTIPVVAQNQYLNGDIDYIVID